ncbi:MAG: amidohydrolase [Anaerolineae bacterium]|nr:amidohydrolase [Anaerolineae bacterium]
MLSLEVLTTLRRTLHAHPELSHHERETATRIADFVRALEPDELIVNLGGHGVMATFDSGVAGPTLLFRCELDALPIDETNTFAHRSVADGVSHKCGHDGHMAILCGFAASLSINQPNRPKRGKVHVLFQPAEETGEGAQCVLNDPQFAAVQPDLGVALHNFPGAPLHAIIVRDGVFTAAVSSLILRFMGRTSHASQPELGINPSLAVAELLRESDALNRNDPSAPEFQLVTPVCVRVGSPAYGVSAGDGEVHLTLRAWDDGRLDRLREAIVAIGQKLAAQYHLQMTTDTLQHFHANVNDASITNLVRQAAKANGFAVIEQPDPLKGGEDFGLFTSRFPCCMFGLGAGDNVTALHSPDYDFPDAIIETGIRMFEGVVRQVLSLAYPADFGLNKENTAESE